MGVQSAPWSSLFPLPSSVPPIHSQPHSRTPSPTPPAACPSCGSLPDTPCLCVFKSCMAFTSLLRCHYCHKAFSVLLVFEDIFLPFHFGFSAPSISCAFHTGGLTSREKASPVPTLPSEYLASLLLLSHIRLEGFADVCRDGGHTQTSI